VTGSVGIDMSAGEG